MPPGEPDRTEPTVTLVVPCFNEAQRLNVNTFAGFASANPDVGFLFVDDGSSDGTDSVIARLINGNPAQFQLKRLPRNGGKAAAVRAGILDALAQAPSVVGYWDADLATPLEELAGMRDILAERPGVHIVTGARVNLLGRSVRRNLIRHWLGRVFATVASGVLRLPIYDTQCGAKLFRVQTWTSQLFVEPFRTTWTFDVELLARVVTEPIASQAGDPRSIICEFPLTTWSETDGSKLRAGDALRAVVELGRIYRHYLRPGRV